MGLKSPLITGMTYLTPEMLELRHISQTLILSTIEVAQNSLMEASTFWKYQHYILQ